MRIEQLYSWEMETADGQILAQYNEQGVEQSWKILEQHKVIRVSIIPSLPLLPRHDIFIGEGNCFVKRFGRGFKKQGIDGYETKEYLNCIVTKQFRAWIFSSGKVLITPYGQEVYL